uniref:Type III crustin cruIII-1 n=1 Tax=Penaeus vannamei TaxID=6689 RepID=A0A7L9R3L0_PENVA|nr:type III crustin cruIII-1 [Penaeus vannamei]
MMTFRGISVCVVCVAVMLMLTSTGQAGPTGQKPGSCPFISGSPPSTAKCSRRGQTPCIADFDCAGDRKCCTLGIGSKVCLKPW